MEIKLKEKFGKYKFVVLALALSGVLLGSVYAVSYLWSSPTTVTIATSSPYIKVYLDSPTGPEVTSINFGNLVPGSFVSISLYIRNTHPNATFIGINWNSTLSDVTDKITDGWVGSWPTSLGPGTYEHTYYQITVASDCPLATYSWTLYLYGPG